jgi:hypothetical protein
VLLDESEVDELLEEDVDDEEEEDERTPRPTRRSDAVNSQEAVTCKPGSKSVVLHSLDLDPVERKPRLAARRMHKRRKEPLAAEFGGHLDSRQAKRMASTQPNPKGASSAGSGNDAPVVPSGQACRARSCNAPECLQPAQETLSFFGKIGTDRLVCTGDALFEIRHSRWARG